MANKNFKVKNGLDIDNNISTKQITYAGVDGSVALFSATEFRSAKLFIQIVDPTSAPTAYFFADASVLHNGTTAYIAVYNEIYTNYTSVFSSIEFNAQITSGNVLLVITGLGNLSVVTLRVDAISI